ncbi:MAG: aldo/keto reductase, partial [Aggregatilineales bacterium]
KIPDNVRVAVAKAIEVSRLHNTTLSRVALQFALNNDAIATTLIGMQTEDEVKQNVSLIHRSYSSDVIKLIQLEFTKIKGYKRSIGLAENDDT